MMFILFYNPPINSNIFDESFPFLIIFLVVGLNGKKEIE